MSTVTSKLTNEDRQILMRLVHAAVVRNYAKNPPQEKLSKQDFQQLRSDLRKESPKEYTQSQISSVAKGLQNDCPENGGLYLPQTQNLNPQAPQTPQNYPPLTPQNYPPFMSAGSKRAFSVGAGAGAQQQQGRRSQLIGQLHQHAQGRGGFQTPPPQHYPLRPPVFPPSTVRPSPGSQMPYGSLPESPYDNDDLYTDTKDEEEEEEEEEEKSPAKKTSKFDVTVIDDLATTNDVPFVQPYFLRRGSRLWLFFRTMGQTTVTYKISTAEESHEITVKITIPFPKGREIADFPYFEDQHATLSGSSQLIEASYMLPTSMKIALGSQTKFDLCNYFGCTFCLVSDIGNEFEF